MGSKNYLKPWALIIPLAMLISCTEEAEDEGSLLLGDWNIEWQSNEALTAQLGSTTMQGSVSFSKSGIASLIAYGFKGSLFLSDTVEKTYQWEVVDNELRLQNENDQFTLVYTIDQLTGNSAALTLFEDVKVNLVKIN
ncbi:MAG: hypothetical protein AAFX87_12730 [Bacteroidota bacterium]